MSERDASRDASREMDQGRVPGGPESMAAAPAVSSTQGATPDAADGPRAASADSAAAPNGGAVTPAGGVNTLRAILLGGPPRTPDDARLTAIERRLDTLSLQLAREPRAIGADGSGTGSGTGGAAPAVAEARLAEIERRLDTHSAQLDAATTASRGGEVTLNTLAALREQVEALRQEQGQLTDQTASRLREADTRCQLRQLRVRTAHRQELLRLRRRVYAPAGSLGDGPNHGSLTSSQSGGSREAMAERVAPQVAPREPAPVWPIAPQNRPPVAAPRTSSAPSTPSVVSQASTTSAPVASSQTSNVAPALDERERHATIRREADLPGARRVWGGSARSLVRSAATLAVVTAQLARQDLRALWHWVRHGRHGRHAGGERDEDDAAGSDYYRQ